MIFGKNNQALEELNARLGFFSKDFDASSLYSYINTACRHLARIFSDEVMEAVEDYYHSDAFDPFSDDDNLTPKDIVTRYFQRTAAAMAYLDLAPNHDLTHDTTGRNISVTDNQRLAYDSQIERSDDALRAIVSSGIDLIYETLETTNAFAQWQDSHQRKCSLDTFFPTAQDFSDCFDIGGSYYVFRKLIPTIRITEASVIKPLLGSLYETLRDDPQYNPQLRLMARRATAVYVMASHLVKGSMSYYLNNIVPSKATAAERLAERQALLDEFSTLTDSLRTEISHLEGGASVRGPLSESGVNEPGQKFYYNGGTI